MDLAVPFSFFIGYRNVTSATPTAQGFLCSIDTGDLDGSITWTMEVVARVSSAAQTGTVDIQQVGGATCGSLAVTGDTNVKRLSGTFTPVSGAQQYNVFLDVTGGATLVVFAVRVIATQTGATKTAYDIPLVTGAGNPAINVTGGPTALTQARPLLWTAANWANATVKLRAVGNPGAGGTLTIGLHDGTSDVGTTVHSTANTNTEGLSSALTMTNGATHTVRGTASAGTDTLASASLRVVISSLSKLEVHRTLGSTRANQTVDWTNAVTSTTVHNISQRVLIDSTKYSALSAIYFEGIGRSDAASGDTIDLRKDGANDAGTAGTSVGSVVIDSATTELVRSGDLLSGWANERYYAGATKGGTAGTLTGISAAVILVLVGTSGHAGYYHQQQAAFD